MTDKTRQDSGSTHIIRYALELGLLWVDGDGRDKVREALDALDALEAQLEAVVADGVRALSAAPGEREQAAQRLREFACVSENDVTDPFHPRYIEGYKKGHAAGRKRAAPQQDGPYAYAVYFPDQPTVELVHDLDELTDDLTNREHQITKLYAAPQPAPAPLSDDTDRLREALQRIEGASMSMYATRSDMLEHCQDIARAALAAQGGKDA